MITFAAVRRLTTALLVGGVLTAAAATGSVTRVLGDDDGGPELPPCPGCVDRCPVQPCTDGVGAATPAGAAAAVAARAAARLAVSTAA
jgi:hypothetical protein